MGREYTVKDIRKRFGVSRETVDSWVKRELITVRRWIGNNRMFNDRDMKAIDLYMNADKNLVTIAQIREEVGISRTGLLALFDRYDIQPVLIGKHNTYYYPRILIPKIKRLRDKYKHQPPKGRDAKIAWGKNEGWRVEKTKISPLGDPTPEYRYTLIHPNNTPHRNDEGKIVRHTTLSGAWDDYLNMSEEEQNSELYRTAQSEYEESR